MRIYKIFIAFLLLGSLASCKKDGQVQIENSYPATPITVTNPSLYRPQPTMIVSKAAGGQISITLQAPQGRTIKEITKVATGTNYGALSATTVGVTTNTVQNLYAASIPVNSNQATFTTSLTEFFQKNTGTQVGTSATSNAELGRQFYFQLTMDNGEVVVPEFVRIFVVD
jgi:hypothetical protein